jgi:hypothetical protein
MEHARIFTGMVLTLGLALLGCAPQYVSEDRAFGAENEAPAHENTPASRHMTRARDAYEAGHYVIALEHYKLAAAYADKLGQFNVGYMYLRGKGTDKNLPRGWAWLELAAERGYPQLAGTARDIGEHLDQAQRQEGRRILEEELLPRYGDDIAVPRVARLMERERRRATGSRLGMIGNLTIITDDGVIGGEEYYADEKWDFEYIVESETRYMRNLARGQIGLRDFETLPDGEEAPKENDDNGE